MNFEQTFTPNWKRLGFKTREESMVHVFAFIKKHEKQILKGSLSGTASISWGVGDACQMTLVMGQESDEIGMAKKVLKRAKNDD